MVKAYASFFLFPYFDQRLHKPLYFSFKLVNGTFVSKENETVRKKNTIPLPTKTNQTNH